MNLQPENDNKALPREEQLASRVLPRSAASVVLLTAGLQAMLREIGVDPKAREGVEEFVQPVIALMNKTDADVIRHSREGMSADTFDAVMTTLEAFGDEFERSARSPDQRRLAVSFQKFVGDLVAMWTPERLPLAVEIPEADLGVREGSQRAAANDNTGPKDGPRNTRDRGRER